jgi:hypothetical protein
MNIRIEISPQSKNLKKTTLLFHSFSFATKTSENISKLNFFQVDVHLDLLVLHQITAILLPV